ncbi:MAG: site-2 protease family protein [Clostridia bacterium]|nr:site-2 protease family protein [Clostridia bacterium]
MGVLSKILNNGFNTDTLLAIFASLFVIFCVLPVHEYAHAITAYKLGDKTAKFKGRLTMNPLAHIDPIGAIMILLVGFGYAKPVPVNMRNFPRNKRKIYMGITALAGPLSNILMAFIMTICYCLFFKLYMESFSSMYYNLCVFFSYASIINISLAVFNLIPIPPLDGSRIMNAVLPDKYYYKIMQYERYIMIALFVLIYIGILDKPLSIAVSAVSDGLIKIASAIVGV